MTTRQAALGLAGVALVAAAGIVFAGGDVATPETAAAQVDARGLEITVYKSPTCGCCRNWIEHLREHGFTVEAIDTDDMAAVKTKLGVPSNMQSCHTAVVAGRVVEGHVPADVILAFLADSTAARGLAVPGMPMGSPGMEGPFSQAYDVFAFDGAGGATVYASR